MRHGTSTLTRGLLAMALAAGVGALAAAPAYAAGAVKVKGTAANKFDPADIQATADASGKVTIAFTAEGTPHTLQSDDLPALNSGNVNAGQTKTLTFAAAAGAYNVYCLYHKSLGMIGTLTVAAAGAGSPTASTSPAPATASASASASEAPAVSATPAATASAAEGVPGVAGNKVLAKIDEERASERSAVSGFHFFTMVLIAFLVVLGAAVLFSTRPRRTG